MRASERQEKLRTLAQSAEYASAQLQSFELCTIHTRSNFWSWGRASQILKSSSEKLAMLCVAREGRRASAAGASRVDGR